MYFFYVYVWVPECVYAHLCVLRGQKRVCYILDLESLELADVGLRNKSRPPQEQQVLLTPDLPSKPLNDILPNQRVWHQMCSAKETSSSNDHTNVPARASCAQWPGTAAEVSAGCLLDWSSTDLCSPLRCSDTSLDRQLAGAFGTSSEGVWEPDFWDTCLLPQS